MQAFSSVVFANIDLQCFATFSKVLQFIISQSFERFHKVSQIDFARISKCKNHGFLARFSNGPFDDGSAKLHRYSKAAQRAKRRNLFNKNIVYLPTQSLQKRYPSNKMAVKRKSLRPLLVLFHFLRSRMLCRDRAPTVEKVQLKINQKFRKMSSCSESKTLNIKLDNVEDMMSLQLPSQRSG